MQFFKNNLHFLRKTNSFERRTQSIHCNARQSDGRIKTNTESPKTEQRGHIQFSGSFVEGTLGETRKSRSKQKKWSGSPRSKFVLEVWDVRGSAKNPWTLSLPIGFMYSIYANMWGILMVNVTIYSIHGSYGLLCFVVFCFFLPNLFPRFPRLKTSRTLSLFVVFEWLRVHITLKNMYVQVRRN